MKNTTQSKNSVEMNTRDVLHLFPPNWHDLLTAEQPDFNSCGTEGAERWLQKMEGGSCHGEKTLFPSTSPCIQAAPDWFGLLGSLVAVDDTRQDGATSLEGTYRFFRLPVHLQRTLLAVISHHASEIPLPLLQKLTRCMQDGRLTDHWMQFHLHELQNHIATFLPKPHSQRSKVVPMTARFLSERSKGLFRKVCESVSEVENRRQGGAAVSNDSIEMSSDRTPGSSGFRCFKEHFRDSHLADGIGSKAEGNLTKLPKRTSKDEFQQNQANHPFDLPADKDQSGPDLYRPKRWKQDTGEGNAVEALVQPPPVLDDQVLDRIVEESELEEGGEGSRVKSRSGSGHVDDVIEMEKTVNPDDDVTKGNPVGSEEMKFIKELGPDVKMQLDALKSAWHSEGSTGHTELCKEALRFMATCTSAQLSEVCVYIDMSAIDLSTLPVVCQSITPKADLFSYTATGILAKELFLDKMTSLTQRAPRALNSAVVNFTQAFPKPAVEGALAPCIVHSEASSVQYDLVSKVAKEALVNDHRAYLLR
eukprot:XP_011678370.1 PREDICTED: uncharacterized protein LOC105445051 isoform X1 [Strongylocentrotus purpuratus]